MKKIFASIRRFFASLGLVSAKPSDPPKPKHPYREVSTEQFDAVIKKIMAGIPSEPVHISLLALVRPEDAPEDWVGNVLAWAYAHGIANEILDRLQTLGWVSPPSNQLDEVLSRFPDIPRVWDGEVLPIDNPHYAESAFHCNFFAPNREGTKTLRLPEGLCSYQVFEHNIFTKQGIGIVRRSNKIMQVQLQFILPKAVRGVYGEKEADNKLVRERKGKELRGMFHTDDCFVVNMVTPEAAKTPEYEERVYHYLTVPSLDQSALDHLRTITAPGKKPTIEVYRAVGYVNIEVRTGKDVFLLSDRASYLTHCSSFADVDDSVRTLASELYGQLDDADKELTSSARKVKGTTDDINIVWQRR